MKPLIIKPLFKFSDIGSDVDWTNKLFMKYIIYRIMDGCHFFETGREELIKHISKNNKYYCIKGYYHGITEPTSII